MLDENNKLPTKESNSDTKNNKKEEPSAKENLSTKENLSANKKTTKVEDKTVENADRETPDTDREELPETNKTVTKVEDKAVENATKETPDADREELPVTNKVVAKVEGKIAESSESLENIEQTTVEIIDYNNFSFEDLVAELSKLVKTQSVQSINDNVTKIKNAFNIKFGELLKIKKDKFLEGGGNSIDFQFSHPIKSTYNSILYDYKIKKKEFYAEQEKQLQENLIAKLDLIEQLKFLIDNAEGTSMYKIFKEIQTNWQNIGPIPRAKYNDTWRTYHHHVERFYDLLHLNNDLRDLDFKHNLDEKLKLVDRAEALDKLEDINVAFKELQVLHKLWKEVGPVAQIQREEVWERFSAATKKVHDKRHDFFKDLKSKFEGNIEKKLTVISQIETYDTSKNQTRIDWQKSIKEIEELRNKFFSIGQVPRVKSNQIWEKFKDANKKFNIEKNKFFKSVKKDHLENLNKKKLLIEQAVSLKDSEDWELTTEVMKKIQTDWKKIGHVPRKYSDKLWKEFKDACNHYFNRLHAKQDEGNKEKLEVFNKKKELLAEIKKAIESKVEITASVLKQYVNNWRDLGRVPYEMRHIEVKFNKLLDKTVEIYSINKQEIEMIKFENLVTSYLEQKNYRKLDNEQLFVRKKIDETIREIQQLENNISFISNVSEDNPLVKNVRKNIDAYKEKLEVWKVKIEYLKQLKY